MWLQEYYEEYECLGHLCITRVSCDSKYMEGMLDSGKASQKGSRKVLTYHLQDEK